MRQARHVTTVRAHVMRTVAITIVVLIGLAYSATRADAARFRSVVDQFGGFSRPQGVAVDAATGDVFVLDYGARAVLKFGSDLRAKSFTALGTNVLDGAGGGDCPTVPADCDQTPANAFSFDDLGAAQVSIDRSGTITDGNIYVTDSLNNVVDVFASSGQYLGQLGATSGGSFGTVGGVTADANGVLYVSDVTNNAVHKFLPTSNPPTPGDFVASCASTRPAQLAVGTLGTAGSLFVTQRNLTVRKYTAATCALVGNVFVSTNRGVAVDATSGNVITIVAARASEWDASGASPVRVMDFADPETTSVGGIGVDGATGRAYVADNTTGTVIVFGPLSILPNVTTDDASSVAETSASVAGVVNPDGAEARWQFEYGTTTAYGSVAPVSPGNAGSGMTDVPVSTVLSGLQSGTTYHYRLRATSVSGTTVGADRAFTTAGPPVIHGARLFHSGQTEAAVGARIYSGLRDTSYHVEWGADSSYGQVTPVPAGSVGSGASLVVAQVELTRLAPGTTYHWRMVARNQNGTVASADQTFTTEQTPVVDGIARPPGAIDGRAYELVSQPDKGSNQTGAMIPSADGNGVIYSLASGGAPGATSGVPTYYAQRTSSGWMSQNASPPREQMPFSQYRLAAASPDLAHWIAGAKAGLGGSDSGIGSALARVDRAGGQQLLRTFPMTFHPSGISVVTSDDLSHVFAGVPEPIVGSHVPGTSNVYDFGSGAPVLVSAMPGTGLAPSCGVTAAEFPMTGQNGVSEHWTSTDGAVLFFATRGNDCGGPRQLYMRDTVGGTTTLVSGPPVGGAPDLGVDGFLQATPGGSRVFFRADTSYTADDGTDGDDTDADIYRWSAANGAFLCVTCAIPRADVPVADVGSNAVVAQDGSRVYFPSRVQAAEAPQAGDGTLHNLYVWRAGDNSVHYVGQTTVGGGAGLSNLPDGGGQATPDGAVFVFSSRDASLDALSASDNGGFRQYYRYDDRDESLTCVSCPPAGPPARDVQTGFNAPPVAVRPDMRVVTDDGSMVFFTTSEKLVPGDVNDGPDIYEWHDGVVKLITSGRFAYPPNAVPQPLSVSADGRDFFFEDLEHHTFDAQDGSIKIYDARIGGGFVAPPPTGGGCDGDQCQGLSPAAPELPDPGSAVLPDGDDRVREPPAKPSFIVRRLTVAQRARAARSGRIPLVVSVSGRGRVTAVATARLGAVKAIVAERRVRAAGAGRVRVMLALSRRARQALARTGRLRVALEVRYSAMPGAKRVSLQLRAQATGRSAG